MAAMRPLRADEAESTEFESERNGYSAASVDEFKVRVARTLRAYEREFARLRQKLQETEERLSRVEDAEDTLNQVYRAASQAKREIIAEAEGTAARIVAEAETHARDVVDSANQESRAIQTQSHMERERIESRYEEYRSGLRELAARMDRLAGVYRLEQQLARQRATTTELEQQLEDAVTKLWAELPEAHALAEESLSSLTEFKLAQSRATPETITAEEAITAAMGDQSPQAPAAEAEPAAAKDDSVLSA